MDTTHVSASAIRFPLTLTSTNDRHNRPDRPVVDEMDFFALKDDSDTRKDWVYGPTGLEPPDVNTGLNLLTRNTSSDQSMVDDDGMLPDAEEKRIKGEEEGVAILQAEFERLGAENHRLRDMLNKVTTDYRALQTHLLVLKQESNPGNPEDGPDSSSIGAENVPRQFMDLGLAMVGCKTEKHTLSSSEGRSIDRSGLPVKGREDRGSREISGTRKSARLREEEFGNRKRTEEGSDQEWLPNNNAARIKSPSKSSVDQTEATIRKARVSVRARSDATMVRKSITV